MDTQTMLLSQAIDTISVWRESEHPSKHTFFFECHKARALTTCTRIEQAPPWEEEDEVYVLVCQYVLVRVCACACMCLCVYVGWVGGWYDTREAVGQ